MPSKPNNQAKPATPPKSDLSGALPFEPASSRKKPSKKAAAAAKNSTVLKPDRSPAATAVPEVISKRMARRMGVFCGIPTSLGMLTFVVSYLVVTQHWLKLPNIAVVLVSMGFFGLGVLGLTYGVLSASWDEERVGSLIGWKEFTLNFGRLVESWRSARQKPQP